MNKPDRNSDAINKNKLFYKQGEKIIIAVAKTREEIEKFQRFLFKIYCLELQWHNELDFPDNLLTDDYDSRSSFIVIRSGSEIIGGMRMVKSSGLGFPHEKESGVSLHDLGEAVDSDIRKKMLKINKNNLREITRFIGKRTNKHVLTFDLAKGWYWYCFHNAVDACFMAVDMRLFLLCEKLSIPLRPVGIPKYCEGSWVIPSILILEDMMTSLKKNNAGLWQYILDEFNIAGKWKD